MSELQKYIPAEGLRQLNKLKAAKDKAKQLAYSRMNLATRDRANDIIQLVSDSDRNSLLLAWKTGNILIDLKANPNDKYTGKGYELVQKVMGYKRSTARRFMRLADWLTADAIKNLRCAHYSVICELLDIEDLALRNALLERVDAESMTGAYVREMVRLAKGEAIRDISSTIPKLSIIGSLSRARSVATDAVAILGVRFDQDVVAVIDTVSKTEAPLALESAEATLTAMTEARDAFNARIASVMTVVEQLRKTMEEASQPDGRSARGKGRTGK